MNNISSLYTGTWNGAANKTSSSPERIKGAAEQFEALMIGQLLKTARESGSSSGWLGTGQEDEAGQTSVDMAEQQLAAVMAKSGGLGLTKVITQGLTKTPQT